MSTSRVVLGAHRCRHPVQAVDFPLPRFGVARGTFTDINRLAHEMRDRVEVDLDDAAIASDVAGAFGLIVGLKPLDNSKLRPVLSTTPCSGSSGVQLRLDLRWFPVRPAEGGSCINPTTPPPMSLTKWWG